MPSMLRCRSHLRAARYGGQALNSATARVAALLLFRAVLLSSALLTACSRTDPAIQAAVDSQLAVDSATATLSLDISVTRGVVHLAGVVVSRDQQRRAVELTRSVRGVKDVVDEMHLSDAVIAAAVKQALLADPLVGKVPIDVDSTNGYTRLMSDQTNKEERTRAVELAKKIDGVTQVEDRMR
jgi:osmotically-inducible protein OsmY